MDKKIVLGLGILSVFLGILSMIIGIIDFVSTDNAKATDLTVLGYYLILAAIISGGLTFVISEEKKTRRIGILGMISGIMGMAQLITVIIIRMLSSIELYLRNILDALVK